MFYFPVNNGIEIECIFICLLFSLVQGNARVCRNSQTNFYRKFMIMKMKIHYNEECYATYVFLALTRV